VSRQKLAHRHRAFSFRLNLDDVESPGAGRHAQAISGRFEMVPGGTPAIPGCRRAAQDEPVAAEKRVNACGQGYSPQNQAVNALGRNAQSTNPSSLVSDGA
jgi:hypothetical protein